MPDFYRWIYNSHKIYPEVEQNRAAQALTRIADKTSTLRFKRNGTLLSYQNVRVEYDNGGRIAQTVFGGVAKQGVVVYGYKGHPDETDTDMEKGDRFVMGSQEFQIIAVLETTGEIQAYAIAMT